MQKMNMEIAITYLQDTIKANNALKLDIIHAKPEGLNIERSEILLEFDPIPEPTQNRTDSIQTVQPKPPTFAQIRYRQSQREQNLLIDGSRYIQPKNEIKLISSVNAKKGQLEFPNREINHVNTDWVTILLLLVTILLATVRIAYPKYIGYLFHSLINYSTSFRMFREKNYSILHGAFRLEAFFYLIFSVFIFQVINYFQLDLTPKNFALYASSLGFVVAYFLIKKFAYKLLGSIFNDASGTSEYLFNMDNFNRVLGIILFPIIALINYYPSYNHVFMVVAGIFIVAVFYLFLLYRGILILLKKQLPLFYLFLYLCTLEFVPLLLIYKVVVL